MSRSESQCTRTCMHVRTCTVPARRLVGFDRLRSGGVKTTRNDRRISGNTDFVIDERLCTLHYHRFYVLLNNHECMAKYAQPNIRYIIICIFFFVTARLKPLPEGVNIGCLSIPPRLKVSKKGIHRLSQLLSVKPSID